MRWIFISETEEPVERPIPKQPHGMGKIGLPGMAGGGLNLAEIRAKRSTVKPSTGPSEVRIKFLS